MLIELTVVFSSTLLAHVNRALLFGLEKKMSVRPNIRKRHVGIIQAPRVTPGEKNATLPEWVNTVTDTWRFQVAKTLQDAATGNDYQESLGEYWNAALGLSDKECDKKSDEETRRAQMDGTLCKQVGRIIRTAVRDNCIPVTIASGRIPALGSLSGLGMSSAERGHLCVEDASSICSIWVDLFCNMDPRVPDFKAHSSRCPGAFLINETFPGIPRHFPGFEWIRPWLSCHRFAIIGLRKPSDDEMAFLESNGIHFCTTDNLASRGAIESARLAINAINPRNDLPIHLTINIFALELDLDPEYLVADLRRIQVEEALDVIDVVKETGMLGAVTILEVDQIPEQNWTKAGVVISDILKRVVGTTAPPVAGIPSDSTEL